jgi:enediyne biosynthesis protein E4
MSRTPLKIASLLCRLAASTLTLLTLTGCHPSRRGENAPVAAPVPVSFTSALTPSVQLPAAVPGIHFRNVAHEAGLDYHWTIPGKRPLNILQTIGNGCAFLDYDNDGNLDILLVGSKLALYRGDGQGHFTDVTQSLGLDKLKGHFLGCAVGDYDNDGYDDLYISGYQTGVLLHNEEGKRFIDVTTQAGLKPQPWGTSCGFADLDGDGYLDLYVANYVKFDKTDLQLCPYNGVLTGCGPNDYDARQGVLYHNEGGRHFQNVTRAWHVNGHGKGLGVAFADYDGTGRTGFAVANDLMPGDLFQSEGHKRFKNMGEAAGAAVDEEGETHAGMGIDWGDYDNDGKPDLFVTTFSKETKCLYHNEGAGLFTITSKQAGVDSGTLPYVGWGCKFFDADNDGWLDLLLANGHVQDNIRRFEKARYRQPTVFLHNKGSASARPVRFEDATGTAGLTRLPAVVGRGLAIGDFDNDGKMDALVVDSEGAPLLLHNESVTANNWIGFHLVGTGKSNRSAYGATVTVIAGGQKRVRQCYPGGSYLSSSDARVQVGLGSLPLEKVIVRWPDGTKQTYMGLKPNHYHLIVEGQQPI